mmetsp:Transcript_18445/g.28720  ORF Transcript_18445/g.28720 Transcript_18445/m.28720 type:complete len:112 (-) Transcript_18445:2602-2937(-)
MRLGLRVLLGCLMVAPWRRLTTSTCVVEARKSADVCNSILAPNIASWSIFRANSTAQTSYTHDDLFLGATGVFDEGYLKSFSIYTTTHKRQGKYRKCKKSDFATSSPNIAP